MPYIPPEVVAQAREMDLLSYLRTYEPQELVHFGGSTYCTREHDSLKISNGGYSALDYLIKVKEMSFTQAVETIIGNLSAAPPAFTPAPKAPKEKVLLLPQVNRSATHAVEYLYRRGIDYFFDSDIAKKYGVNAAVLACFLWDCIEQKSTESPQLHGGKVWVRCSVQMMTGSFPFLSYDEIRYALKRLVKGRVLTKGQFNESRFDRTNWYAFTEFGQFLMAESEGRTQ